MSKNLYFSSTKTPRGLDYRIGLYRPAMKALFGREYFQKGDVGHYALLQKPGGIVAVIGDLSLSHLLRRINEIQLDPTSKFRLIAQGTATAMRSSGSKDEAGNKIKIPRGEEASTAAITVRSSNFKWFRDKHFGRHTSFDRDVRPELPADGIGVRYRHGVVCFGIPNSLRLKRSSKVLKRIVWHGLRPTSGELFPSKKVEPLQVTKAPFKPAEVITPPRPTTDLRKPRVVINTSSVLLVGPEGEIFKENLTTNQHRMIAAVINTVRSR